MTEVNKEITNFTWDAPTVREDDTPLDQGDIASYNVYYGSVAGDYQSQLTTTTNSIDLDFTTLPLPLFLVVTSVDQEGRESLYSKEHQFTLKVANPKPPTNLRLGTAG